jgi:hypothetical protein
MAALRRQEFRQVSADESLAFVAAKSLVKDLDELEAGLDGRFRAAVSMRPVINWHSFVGTTDGPMWYDQFQKKPWEDPLEYAARSPLHYVANVKTPTMVMTGAFDGEKFGALGLLGGMEGKTHKMGILRKGKAIPQRSAPRAIAFAISSPLRIPPVAMRGKSSLASRMPLGLRHLHAAGPGYADGFQILGSEDCGMAADPRANPAAGDQGGES